MADMLHQSLANFRDTMLTAIAKLEFQLRDTYTKPTPYTSYNRWAEEEREEQSSSSESFMQTSAIEASLKSLMTRIDNLEQSASSCSLTSMREEFLTMQPIKHTRNILVPSIRSTPALAAAVAAASAIPSDFTLAQSESEEEEESVDEVEIVEEEESVDEVEIAEEEEVVEEEQEDASSTPELKRLEHNGETYFIGSSNSVYEETDEGYEQIGSYNPKTNELTRFEQEEEEEEEDVVEVEEFIYKGKTYQRDTENTVYLEGDPIGTWNGKKILPLE